MPCARTRVRGWRDPPPAPRWRVRGWCGVTPRPPPLRPCAAHPAAAARTRQTRASSGPSGRRRRGRTLSRTTPPPTWTSRRSTLGWCAPRLARSPAALCPRWGPGRFWSCIRPVRASLLYIANCKQLGSWAPYPCCGATAPPACAAGHRYGGPPAPPDPRHLTARGAHRCRCRFHPAPSAIPVCRTTGRRCRRASCRPG